MSKCFRYFGKFRKRKKQTNKCLICILYNFHNSYFVFCVDFVDFVILCFLYFYFYIYYTCTSLTCGLWLHVPCRGHSTFCVLNHCHVALTALQQRRKRSVAKAYHECNVPKSWSAVIAQRGELRMPGQTGCPIRVLNPDVQPGCPTWVPNPGARL